MNLTFSSRLNPVDASYYFMGKLPYANVGMTSLAISGEAPSFSSILDKWTGAAGRVGRLRQVLRPSAFDLTAPRWTYAREFNIDDHVNHVDLGPQAPMAALMQLVDGLQSSPFDYTKPLWSYTFVSGLEGGQAAGILRLHHCLSDGAALLAIFGNVSMSNEVLQGVGIDVITDNEAVRPLTHAVREVGSGLRELAASIRSVAANPNRSREQLSRDLRRYILPLPDRGGKPSGRRRAILCRLPLHEWQEAARARGAGVNELYLAVVAATWRRYASAVGLSIGKHVRIGMPINLREGEQQRGGNFLGVGIVECEGGREELTDLKRLRIEASKAKLEDRATGSRIMTAALALMPGRVAGSLSFRHSSFPDTVASKLGSPLPLDLGGAPIDQLFMLLSVIGSPFACGLFTYNDFAHLSLNCDLGFVSDVPRLATALDDTVREIFTEGDAGINRASQPRC